MKTLLTLMLWCLLFMLCWPIASQRSASAAKGRTSGRCHLYEN